MLLAHLAAWWVAGPEIDPTRPLSNAYRALRSPLSSSLDSPHLVHIYSPIRPRLTVSDPSDSSSRRWALEDTFDGICGFLEVRTT